MVLWAYFDESGHPKDPKVRAFSLAGIRSTCDDWLRFSDEWKAVLLSENVSWFHMRELNSRSSTSPYRGWTKEKRQEFLMRLVEVVTSRLKTPIIFVERLLEARKREKLEELYCSAYWVQIHGAVWDLPETDKVHLVFAMHPQMKPIVLRAYQSRILDAYAKELRDERVGTITFGRPSEEPALQAADLVAWEFARRCHTPSPVRPSMQRLLEMKPVFYS